jgi:hypothetical protein
VGLRQQLDCIMGSTGSSKKERTASYADALRGHKLFNPESKSAEEVKAVAAHERAGALTDEPNTGKNAAKKTPPKKGTKSTQKKGHKPGSTGVHESESQIEQTAKGSRHKSPKSKARTAKQPAKSPFSYAEAVKGKQSPATRRPKNAQASEETQAAADSFTQAAVSGFGAKTSSISEFEQGELNLEDIDKTEDSHDTCRGVWSEEHDAAQLYRYTQFLSEAYDTDMISEDLSHGDNSMIPPHGQNEPERESQDRPERLYKQQPRRFSADVSAPLHPSSVSSSLPSSPTAFSTPSATFAQLSHQASSAPSSTTFVMVYPNGDSVDETIKRIIENDNKRTRILVEREQRLRDVITAHNHGEIS